MPSLFVNLRRQCTFTVVPEAVLALCLGFCELWRGLSSAHDSSPHRTHTCTSDIAAWCKTFSNLQLRRFLDELTSRRPFLAGGCSRILVGTASNMLPFHGGRLVSPTFGSYHLQAGDR